MTYAPVQSTASAGGELEAGWAAGTPGQGNSTSAALAADPAVSSALSTGTGASEGGGGTTGVTGPATTTVGGGATTSDIPVSSTMAGNDAGSSNASRLEHRTPPSALDARDSSRPGVGPDGLVSGALDASSSANGAITSHTTSILAAVGANSTSGVAHGNAPGGPLPRLPPPPPGSISQLTSPASAHVGSDIFPGDVGGRRGSPSGTLLGGNGGPPNGAGMVQHPDGGNVAAESALGSLAVRGHPPARVSLRAGPESSAGQTAQNHFSGVAHGGMPQSSGIMASHMKSEATFESTQHGPGGEHHRAQQVGDRYALQRQVAGGAQDQRQQSDMRFFPGSHGVPGHMQGAAVAQHQQPHHGQAHTAQQFGAGQHPHGQGPAGIKQQPMLMHRHSQQLQQPHAFTQGHPMHPAQQAPMHHMQRSGQQPQQHPEFGAWTSDIPQHMTEHMPRPGQPGQAYAALGASGIGGGTSAASGRPGASGSAPGLTGHMDAQQMSILGGGGPGSGVLQSLPGDQLGHPHQAHPHQGQPVAPHHQGGPGGHPMQHLPSQQQGAPHGGNAQGPGHAIDANSNGVPTVIPGASGTHAIQYHTGTVQNPVDFSLAPDSSGAVGESLLAPLLNLGGGNDHTAQSTDPNRANRYACETCGETFRQKRQRDAHVRSQHERSFPCSRCPSRFKTRSDVNRHNRIVHLKHKPFACSQCKSVFAERGKLRRHTMTVHEKLRPHVCHTCGAAFGERGNLNQHLTSRHGTPAVPQVPAIFPSS